MARVTLDDQTLNEVQDAIRALKYLGHPGLTVKEVIRDAVNHFLSDLPHGYLLEIPARPQGK